jgi:hypothetical protein
MRSGLIVRSRGITVVEGIADLVPFGADFTRGGADDMRREGQTHQSGVAIFWNQPELSSGNGLPLLCAWAILSFGLILTKLAFSLGLSWILILAPIWLPVLAGVGLLLGAMFLDSLRD